jgi:hypothetical protein
LISIAYLKSILLLLNIPLYQKRGTVDYRISYTSFSSDGDVKLKNTWTDDKLHHHRKQRRQEEIQ